MLAPTVIDACLYCDADLSSNPQVDLYGNPCCGDCFDNAAFLEHPTVERVPALLSANKTPQHDLVKQKREEQRRNTLMPSAATLGPAVSELKNRLTTAGLEKVSSPSTVVLQKHAPPAQASSQLAASRYTATANRNAQTSTIGTKVTSPIAAGSAAFNVKQSEPAPGSPRPPITSPRIAACKAFFDGHSTGSPALASASMAGPSNVWSRPSPSPIQVPAWKTHRPSQSMPVIPKQTLPPSGPAWLKSPILAGKAATFLKTGKIAGPVVHARDIPHVPLSPVIPDMPAGPSTRVSRPLPRPPSSYTSAASTVKTAPKPDSLAESVDHSSSAKMPSEGKAPISQVTSSPKKVSAGILTRSRSFRQAEGTVTEAKDAYDHRTPKSGFQKSSSAGELTDSSTVTCNPPAQQAQKGLSHSNAIFNGKSPVREKRMPGEAAHEVVTKNGPDQVVNTADTGLSADTRCAACKLRLFGMLGTETAPGAGHKIIVLPNNDERYHAKCFTCDKCKKPFNDGVFVEVEQGQRVHEKVRRILRTHILLTLTPLCRSVPCLNSQLLLTLSRAARHLCPCHRSNQGTILRYSSLRDRPVNCRSNTPLPHKSHRCRLPRPKLRLDLAFPGQQNFPKPLRSSLLVIKF